MTDASGTGNASDNYDLGRLSVEHRARRLSAPRKPPPPPVQKGRVLRRLVLFGGLIAAALVLVPFADVANADYPEARALADRLDAAYESVWRGDASFEAAATANGFSVVEFSQGEQAVSIAFHAQPTKAGKCYGLRMGGSIGTSMVRFVPSDGCVPLGRAAFEDTGSWSDVLPSERITVVWFVPAMIALLAGAMAVATDIVLKLLSK